MSVLIKRLALLVVLSFVVTFVATTSASSSSEAQSTQVVQASERTKLRNGCTKLFTQKRFIRYATKVYRRDKISRKARIQIRRMIRCQHSPKAERKMRVKRRALQADGREWREWRYYKTHQLPWCTWGPESGRHLPPFHPSRYTAKNPVSTAGGKYQFIDSTWYGLGGSRHFARHPAAHASPLEQERLARRLYAQRGGSPWVNC